MNRISIYPITLFLIMHVCILNAAEGAPAREDLPVFDLGSIEVIGKLNPLEITATKTVSAQEFDKIMVEDLSEAIRKIPGINTTVDSKNETQFMIRGLYQERVLVLMDGIPMAAPYYGDLDSSEIPLDNLQEIKVVRGNASVLYGPNAMGGVVSMVSPKPDLKPNLKLYSTIDQEGNIVGRLSHGNRFGNYYYQLSAGIRESDGWSLSDDFDPVRDEDGNLLENGNLRDNSYFSQYSGSLKFGVELEDSEFSISAAISDSKKGIPPTSDPDDRVRFRKFPLWKKSTVTAAGKKWFGDNVELRANVFYHKYDNIMRDYSDPDYSDLRWESTYDDYSTGLNTRISWNLTDNWALKTAFHAVQDNHKSQGDIGDPWEEYEAKTYSLAGQSDWQVSSSFALQIGASYDLYDFDSVNNVAGDSSVIADRTRDIDDVTGSIIGEFAFTDTQKFTLAISRKLQLPTMHQLFSNIEEFESTDIGLLDPEKAMEYALGYEVHSSTTTHFGVAAFYYDIEDMIVRPDRD
ncbi:TonB-dependent receptor, partial [bacterium]|nr:TonB-dependent receptor [bacterium]